jgi:hypothetical protein
MPLPLRLIPVVFFLAAACAAAAPASTETASPPSAPFVAVVPDRAQWTLTVSSATAAPVPAPAAAVAPRQIVKIHFIKAGRIVQRVVSYSDGTTWEVWFADGLELNPGGPGGSVQVIAPGPPSGSDTPLGSPLLWGGFPGTEWLSAAHYGAAVTFQKALCYHYLAPDPHAGGQAEAWIDTGTNLPQGFVSQGMTYLYEMQDPPSGPLVLPSAYQAAFDAYRKAVERRNQLSAGPPR